MPIFITLCIALIGGLLGFLTQIPIGEMLGAMLAIVICSRFYCKLCFPKHMLTVIQIILGISVGSVVQPGHWGTSLNLGVLIGLIICMMSQITVGYFWLSRRCGWTKAESLLGSVPGALAAIIVMTDAQEKPSYRVIFTHSIRLIFLIALASIIAVTNHSPATQGTDLYTQIFDANYLILISISLASLILGSLLNKIGIPAPYMLTAMILTSIFSATIPTYPYNIPEFYILISMALMGGLIGIRLQGITRQETIASIQSGIMVTCLSLTVTLIMAFIFSIILSIPFSVLVLSWVPGSLESMTAVAILLNLEPAFVMVNHIVRLTLLYLMPIFLGPLIKQPKRDQP